MRLTISGVLLFPVIVKGQTRAAITIDFKPCVIIYWQASLSQMHVCDLERWLTTAMLLSAMAVFAVLMSGMRATYGKFNQQAHRRWPKIGNRLAWMVRVRFWDGS